MTAPARPRPFILPGKLRGSRPPGDGGSAPDPGHHGQQP